MRGSVALLVALVCGLCLPGAADAYSFPDPELQPTGPPVTAFDWTTDSCQSNDIPDIPARAFRDSAGQVVLIASHFTNRRAVGPDLENVQHRCEIVLDSLHNEDPSLFSDREWVHSTYVLPDGSTVMALIHEEYQGNRHPGRCPSGDYFRCWYNSIGFAKSTDGGATFSHISSPATSLVAVSPYRYIPDVGPSGLLVPSNIVRNPVDGYYYVMFGAHPHEAQRAGTCVMRTNDLSDPSSWRAWDGSAYTVAFVNPYTTNILDPAAHVCTPLAEIGFLTASVTYNTYLEKYVLVGTARFDPATGEERPGLYWSTSPDLIQWTRSKRLLEGEVAPSGFRCGDADPIRDPALLDPTSTSPNFETTGRQVDLFFTQFHADYYPGGCSLGLNRDLVRIPVRFNKELDCSTVHATPSYLSSTNRDLFPVTITGAGGTGQLTWNIDTVTQNEPVIGPGDSTGPDAMRTAAANQVLLRAERGASASGRVYRIGVTVEDSTGASCSATPTVSVPQGAVDAGTLFHDSFARTDVQHQLSVSGVSRTELDSGQRDFVFTVSLSSASSTPVTVDYSTEDGTATAGSDFEQTAGTITFGPGWLSKTVPVKVNGDTTFEPDEDFSFRLSNAGSTTIVDETAIGSITNDDDQPDIFINDGTAPEGGSGQSDLNLTVSLSNPSSTAVEVDYISRDGTAIEGSDYDRAEGTLTIEPGQTSKVVTVPIRGDSTFESDEDLSVDLSNPTGGSIAIDTARGTIRNDDGRPAITIEDVSQLEGSSGTTAFVFGLSLSNASTERVTVDYATEDGTALSGYDYYETAGSVSFEPGQTAATAAVTVEGDTSIEPDEYFTLRVANPVNATIQRGSSAASIRNDDWSYARPKAATNTYVPLVTAYQPCTEPNRAHQTPFVPGGSCAPPAPASPRLTSGTPDANGATANFAGSVRLHVCAPPECAAADVVTQVTLTDVRCQAGVTACESSNLVAGADYAGELGIVLPVRLTDKNGVTPGGLTDRATTATDFFFPATVGCRATGDATIGASCDLATTANALVPGSITGGARAIWELGQITVYDGGADGLVSTPDGAAPYAVQGVFVP